MNVKADWKSDPLHPAGYWSGPTQNGTVVMLLIVLVRVPTLFPAAGKAIFRGYMVGERNFVGSWRSYAENIQAIPVEGPFALSRVEDTSPRPPSPLPHSPSSSLHTAAPSGRDSR